MKQKHMWRIAGVLLSVLMLFTTFASVAIAEGYQWSRQPADIVLPEMANSTWHSLGAAVRTEQNAKYFVVTTTAGDHNEQLYVSFPAEGGFRLQSKHEYQNQVEQSNIGLFEPSSIATIDYKKDGSKTVMTGADGTILRFEKTTDGFVFEVCNKSGKKLIGITNKQISFAYDNDKTDDVVGTMVEMPLAEKEGIYGGGERFSDTNLVGTYFSLTNADAWSQDDMTYNNVPLFHSNRGYSVWYNMTYAGEADMGYTLKNRYSVMFYGDKLDFYLWTGMPTENIKKYTDLTGTSGMYNEWTFGFWTGAQSAAFSGTRKMNAYDNMVDLLEGYAQNYNFYPEAMYGEGDNSSYARNIQYQRQRGVKSLYWFYPASDPSAMPNYLTDGIMYPKWDDDGNLISGGYPYSYVASRYYREGTYQFQRLYWYDYSNPSTLDITRSRMIQLWNWGVQGAMIDYGEHYPLAGVSFNGLSNMEMHNLNSYYYAKHSEQAWQEHLKGDYVLFQRSGTAGSQYYVGNFLGDQQSTWDGYQDQIYAMVSLGASGFNLYGGDLGGLSGKMTDELMSRWTVLSTFSPWMRQHGSNIHTPWEQGDANKKNFGTYYYFRKNIVPTVMSAAMDANQNANPILEGMMVAYPYQLKLVDINNQYMFCDDFLVCAVTTAGQHTLDVSLPNGDTWYSLFTYDRFEGGQKIKAEAPTAFMPVFVKDGAVKAINLPESLKLGAEMHDDGAAFAEEELLPHASLLITPPDEERTTTIHVMDGDVKDFRTYDSHTEVYVSKPVSNSTFTITNDEGSPRNTVLALGVTAKEITYDGKTLSRLSHMPDYFQEEYGYYVELSGLTTIYLPADWKELKIVKGDAEYQPYEAYGVSVKAAERMLDNDPTTVYQLPLGQDRYTEIGLSYDQPQEIGRVVVKWAPGYLGTYDIEYSEDGENWYLLSASADNVHTVEDGAGSFDVIEMEESVKASYLRISSDSKAVGVLAPSIYALDVYAPDDFKQMQASNTPPPEYQEEEEIIFEIIEEESDIFQDDDEEDNEEDDETITILTPSGKKKRKMLIYPGFPYWIIAVAAVVVAGAAVLIVLLIKRKKKQAQAAEAAEESPTDFPEPPTE